MTEQIFHFQSGKALDTKFTVKYNENLASIISLWDLN